MELRLPKSINKFFWFLFPLIMVLNSICNIFYIWQLPHYGFNELEDFGRLLVVLGLSACESALLIIFLWWIKDLFKKFLIKS